MHLEQSLPCEVLAEVEVALGEHVDHGTRDGLEPAIQIATSPSEGASSPSEGATSPSEAPA